jgi:uncharacterized DUF497 family protein
MPVVWDPAKAKLNRRNHGVAFPDAELALYDPHGLTREDETAVGEQRLVTIGIDALGRVVVVVFAYRGDAIRLISARKGYTSRKESI